MPISIIDKYKSDFDELVDTLIDGYYHRPLAIQKEHLRFLRNSLKEKRSRVPLERDDVVQELSIKWIQFEKKFNKTKPKIHIRQYLRRRSVWFLRDWFNRQMKKITLHPIYEEDSFINNTAPFTLSLRFLLYGTSYRFLSDLSPYERYLIFLRYKLDRTILEIAYAVQKDDITIERHFKKIFNKIRSKHVECNEESV